MSYSKLGFPHPQKRASQDIYSNAFEVYSSLSKKPADLNTTDIALSVIRIFLGDGGHRTLNCTPETTCGELVDQLLTKLGLTEQRDEHSLQIKYQYSAPRVALDTEKVSELNDHVWDTIERIYLCRVTAPPVPMKKKKRLASYDSIDSTEENIYQNCGVAPKIEPDTTSLSPVLVNEKLANNFARAWNEGETKEEEGIKIPTASIAIETCDIDKAYSLPHCPSYPQYTLEREKKKGVLRRQTPVSDQGTLPRKRRSKTPEHTRNMETNTQATTEHFTIATSPDLDEDKRISMRVQKHRSSSCGNIPLLNVINRMTSPELTPKVAKYIKRFDKLQQKCCSEECLLTATDETTPPQKRASSAKELRDSGYQEFDTTSECSLGDMCPVTPTKCSSLFEISCRPTPKNVPSSALATHTLKVKNSPSDENAAQTPSLRSSISMELLTGTDIQAIADATLNKYEDEVTSAVTTFRPHFSAATSPEKAPPTVPKRSSACTENCTVSDQYLLSQGKRLSQMMNIPSTPNSKKDKGQLKNLFEKVGTLLRKGKGTPTHKSQSSKKRLGYPDTPSPMTSPSTNHPVELANSQGVRWSKVLYDEVVASPTSPNVKFTIVSKTEKLSPKLKKSEGYDVVVPAPIPHKNPYMTVVSVPDVKGEYANPETSNDDNHFYHTPPPQRQTKATGSVETQNTRLHYENQEISKGSTDEITFDGEALHIYSSPKNTTPSPAENNETSVYNNYENTEIRATKNGIAIGRAELHVYQVPGEIRSPVPPLPPKSPSCLPSNSTSLSPLSPKPQSPVPTIPPKPDPTLSKPDPKSKCDIPTGNQVSSKPPVNSFQNSPPIAKPALIPPPIVVLPPPIAKPAPIPPPIVVLPPPIVKPALIPPPIVKPALIPPPIVKPAPIPPPIVKPALIPPPIALISPPIAKPALPPPMPPPKQDSIPHTFTVNRENIYEDMMDDDVLGKLDHGKKFTPSQKMAKLRSYGSTPEFIASSIDIWKQPLPSKPEIMTSPCKTTSLGSVSEIYETISDFPPSARTDEYVDMKPIPNNSDGLSEQSKGPPLPPPKPAKSIPPSKCDLVLVSSGKREDKRSPSHKSWTVPVIDPTSQLKTKQREKVDQMLQNTAKKVPLLPPTKPSPNTNQPQKKDQPISLPVPAPLIIPAPPPLHSPSGSKTLAPSKNQRLSSPFVLKVANAPEQVPSTNRGIKPPPVSQSKVPLLPPFAKQSGPPTPPPLPTYDVPGPQKIATSSTPLPPYDVPGPQKIATSSTPLPPYDVPGPQKIATSSTPLPTYDVPGPQKIATSSTPLPPYDVPGPTSSMSTPPIPPPPPKKPASPPPPPPIKDLKPRFQAMGTASKPAATPASSKPHGTTSAELFSMELMTKLKSRQVS